MKTFILILVATLALAIQSAMAADLTYPTTEKGIIDALTLKNGTAQVAGIEYISEGGKVYKIINGKRVRARGMEDIVDTNLAPKAGALIHFDFNSAIIPKDSFALLDNYASALKGALSEAKLQVGGHTDSIGDPDVNLALSRRRADAVRNYLIQEQGIASMRLTTAAFGATKPVESNDTPSGRLKNRRVEFVRIE